jgi:bla regulator protein BlaR1
MIVAWMMYCLLVAALLGMAALAAERACRLAGLPSRWIWLGSLAAGLVVPIAARILPVPGSPGASPAGSGAPGSLQGSGPSSLFEAIEHWWAASAIHSSLDGPILATWAAASVLVLSILLAGYARLRRERRDWELERIDEVDVRVSEDRGPAAVGFARIEVVLPRWVLACTATERRLILLHEMEHRRAGDSRLIVAALATAVLMPWNPLVWWQLKRLRVATELDCDRRVLRKGADVRAYASLLLNAKLEGLGAHLLTATLFRSRSELGRRIEAMTALQPSHRYLRAVAAFAVGGGVLFAACETPAPSGPEADATAAVAEKPATEVPFGTVREFDAQAALTKIHEVMTTDPDKAAEMKAQFHDAYGNVFVPEYGTWAPKGVDAGEGEGRAWTTEGGDVHLMRIREYDAQNAEIIKLIKEGKLTKEAFDRQQAPDWVSDESANEAKFGPAD